MTIQDQREGASAGARGAPSNREPEHTNDAKNDPPSAPQAAASGEGVAAGANGGLPRRLFAWVGRTIESIDPALTPRFLFGAIGGLLLGAIALVIVLRSESGMDPVAVRLAGPLSSGTTSSAEDVRIAVGSAWGLSDRFEHYDGLAAYLRERLGRPIIIVQRRTDGEVHDLLARGDVQAAVICTGSYVHARLQDLELEPIAVPLFDHEPTYQSLVIVRRSSHIHSLADLRGHSFAFTDPTSLAGYYDPVAELLEQGASPAAFFSRTVFTYGFGESMDAVRNGSVDAAAVDSLVYESEASRSSSWRDALRVVRRSPAYGIGPLVVAPSTSEDLRLGLIQAWLGMHDSPDGRAVLHSLNIDRFVAPPHGLYDSAALVVERVHDYAQGIVP